MIEELYYAELTDTRTGEARIYRDEYFDVHDGMIFLWEQGNYSCDCNRAIFFARAAGEPDGTDEDPEIEFARCSDGRFRVKLIAEDGRVLFEEPIKRPSGRPGGSA